MGYVIRFFFEYGGGVLWGGNETTVEKYGYPIQLEKLPLTKSTIEKLRWLETTFQSSLNLQNPLDEDTWSKKQWEDFDLEATIIFDTLVQELGREYIIINEHRSVDL